MDIEITGSNLKEKKLFFFADSAVKPKRLKI